MKRGDIYLAAAKGDFVQKARPVVIVQRDLSIPMLYSIVVCP